MILGNFGKEYLREVDVWGKLVELKLYVIRNISELELFNLFYRFLKVYDML